MVHIEGVEIEEEATSIVLAKSSRCVLALTYSMVSKRCLASLHPSLCMEIASSKEQYDGQKDECNNSPFDGFRCVRVPPTIIIIRIAVEVIILSLAKVNHFAELEIWFESGIKGESRYSQQL